MTSCNKAKSGAGETQNPSCNHMTEWASPRDVREWRILETIRYSWTSNTRNTKSRDPMHAEGRNCGAKTRVTARVRSWSAYKTWRMWGGTGGKPRLVSHENASVGVLFMILNGNFLLSWCCVATVWGAKKSESIRLSSWTCGNSICVKSSTKVQRRTIS